MKPKNLFSFNWQYGDFEIRTLNHLKDNLPYVELVKWMEDVNGKRHCFVLALYQWDEEGGSLRFIGERPFREIAEIDLSPIWKQLLLACEMLKDWYEKETADD